MFRPDGEKKKRVLNAIGRRSSTRLFALLGKAHSKRWLTNVVQLRSKRVFSTFPIGAKRNNTLGIDSTRSVSYHHFEWAFPSRAKSRVDERRPIAFKRRVFSTFPIGAKRNNTLRIEFHEVGFIPPIRVGFSKQGKKPG